MQYIMAHPAITEPTMRAPSDNIHTKKSKNLIINNVTIFIWKQSYYNNISVIITVTIMLVCCCSLYNIYHIEPKLRFSARF